MSFNSSLAASAEQHDGLKRLAVSANRAEADRARAILLSLSGWKSAAIGEVFGVREDTVRNWRSIFMREGLAGIERHPAPGCAPVKADAQDTVLERLMPALDLALGHRMIRRAADMLHVLAVEPFGQVRRDVAGACRREALAGG